MVPNELLCCRLKFLDANQPLRCQEPEAEFSMRLPDQASCKDLHDDMQSNIPGVTIGRLEQYLAQFEKKFYKTIKCFYTER